MTSDPKIEYLNIVHARNELIDLLLANVSVIQSAGPEGILETVAISPDIILNAITGLAAIVEVQRDEINKHIADKFEIYDAIDKINTKH